VLAALRLYSVSLLLSLPYVLVPVLLVLAVLTVGYVVGE
jgi:hypothetical protein